MKRISFKNKTIDIAGNIHFPKEFDETRTYAALVLATPGSSVKEQVDSLGFLCRLTSDSRGVPKARLLEGMVSFHR